MLRENAGEFVDSARLARDAKCGEAAAGVVRGFSATPLMWTQSPIANRASS